MEDELQRSWWERQLLWRQMSIVVGAVVAFVLIWWLIPPLLYGSVAGSDDARLKAVTDTRTALLAGLVGVGALGTFWLNSRVYRVTARTLQVTEQGQLTDRYTKAIAQLGDGELDVRLGGIYALERIAVDSKRDHPTVVEVLSAYARERSAPTHMVRPANRRTAHPSTLRKRVKLGVDVQTALTVLGRLPTRAEVSRGDLSQADLTGARLYKANLAGARFTGANLIGVHLHEAKLTKGILLETNLTNAELLGTDLTGAYLLNANLTNVFLIHADVTGAQFTGANLTGAYLLNANLTNANFHGANLTNAHLGGANLTGANFSEADLIGADLGRAADLTTARGLTQQQVDTAVGNEFTLLPANLRRPEGWCSDAIKPVAMRDSCNIIQNPRTRFE